MKEVGKNEMFYKTGRCRDCIHSIYYHGIIKDFTWWCTRFPTWIEINDVDAHWCGEWKAEVQDE